MLTRKYYNMIASILNKSKSIKEAKLRFITELKLDNPSFNEERFAKAVGKWYNKTKEDSGF